MFSYSADAVVPEYARAAYDYDDTYVQSDSGVNHDPSIGDAEHKLQNGLATWWAGYSGGIPVIIHLSTNNTMADVGAHLGSHISKWP